jgi:hypothetical protein
LVSDASSPPGTEVAVRDLFYNTPARLKFLRADNTEVRHVVEVVQRLSLPHPDVAFQITHNGRTLLDYPAVNSGLDRIHSVLGDPDSRGVYPLEPAEQERLAEELAGRRTPDLPARLEQMRRLGVFARVAGEVAVELADARAALAPWQALAPAPRLGELADLLEAQVRSLAPAT